MSDIEWVRLFALPVGIGIITACVTAFISFLRNSNERQITNRKEQLDAAQEACTEILGTLDELYSYIEHDAWYVAWRKRKVLSLSEKAFRDVDLEESDKAKWRAFESSLAKWRAKDIIFETKLDAYFEVEDFGELRKLIDLAADELWDIYYAKADQLVYSQKIKAESRHKFSQLLRRLRAFIRILSMHLVKCIQKESVGNLRTMVPTCSLGSCSSESADDKSVWSKPEQKKPKSAKDMV